ncbi:MAG: DedA family protein [Candidatus Omnitrophica bacterium]|nr:DedA family protein [Candidatus Omnitrophota bacterium]
MIPLLEAVKPWINHYGYWAVFFCVFFESLGFPLPGETLIVAAGLYAAHGTLDPLGIVFLTVTATFIANNVSYVVGYYCGRSFLVKYGKYIFINERRLFVLEDFVNAYGNKITVVARFILGLRQFNGFIMGTVRVPWVGFAVYNMLGAVLWAGWWIGIAYYLGKKFGGVFIEHSFLIGLGAAALFIIMAWHFFKKHQ